MCDRVEADGASDEAGGTSLKRPAALVLLLSIALASSSARAAGGPHVVDDSEPETPGVCHFETWVSPSLSGGGYVNESPACTMTKIPWLQLGAAYQHFWGPTFNGPIFGPAAKINFRHEDSGLGVGLGLNSGVNLQTGELATASTLMLVTVPIDDKVRFNFNAGWSYVNSDTPNSFFYGGQFEAEVGGDILLMIEAFGRAANSPGTQMGLRYTPHGGPFDFDLLVANYFGAVNTQVVTFGVTIRY